MSRFVAVTKLQADALVTIDQRLARAAEGFVPLAPFEELKRNPHGR